MSGVRGTNARAALVVAQGDISSNRQESRPYTQSGTEPSPGHVGFYRITAGNTDDGWDVVLIGADDENTSATFTRCRIAPRLATPSVGDIVLGVADPFSDRPVLAAIGGTSGGGSGASYKAIVTADNEDGTYDVNQVNFDDESTVEASFADVAPYPYVKLFVGDEVWLEFNADGSGVSIAR